MSGLISRWRPVPSLTKVKERRPRLRPGPYLGIAALIQFGAEVPVWFSNAKRVRQVPHSIPLKR